MNKYYCDICKVTVDNKAKEIEKHNLSQKHLTITSQRYKYDKLKKNKSKKENFLGKKHFGNNDKYDKELFLSIQEDFRTLEQESESSEYDFQIFKQNELLKNRQLHSERLLSNNNINSQINDKGLNKKQTLDHEQREDIDEELKRKPVQDQDDLNNSDCESNQTNSICVTYREESGYEFANNEEGLNDDISSIDQLKFYLENDIATDIKTNYNIVTQEEESKEINVIFKKIKKYFWF